MVINFTSNHPHNRKLVAFHYYIDILNNLPITNAAAEREWKQILAMAHNNGFPKHIIQEMKNKKRPKTNNVINTQPLQPQANTWITFIFHSPAIYKVTNLFKNTKLKTIWQSYKYDNSTTFTKTQEQRSTRHIQYKLQHV
jgi:hypothetical protein